MAKASPDIVLDGALNVIATATRMIACSAQPTTYTEANATYALADVSMDDPGTHYWRWESTGAAQAADQGELRVIRALL